MVPSLRNNSVIPVKLYMRLYEQENSRERFKIYVNAIASAENSE